MSCQKNPWDTQLGTPGMMGLYEIAWIGTPGKDQTQTWYSREGPKGNLDLVTEKRCDICDISHP